MSDSIVSTGRLLGLLYGAAATAGSGNPILALRAAEKNRDKQVAAKAAEPQVKREVAAFRAAVAKAKDPASLLSNPAFLKVLLTCNGLGDQASYTALAKKALLSDTTEPSSLANTLPDARWKEAAATYDFANKGLEVIKNPAVLDTIADGYAEVTWRRSLDEATPGLSNALDFRARASTIKSVVQILGDATLRTVVTTALGIPPQIAYQGLVAQERAIGSRVDVARFKDTKFVDQFANRYLLQAAGDAAASRPVGLVSLAARSRGLIV